MDVQRFLKELTANRYYQEQISYIKELPSREAVYGEVTPALATAVTALLAAKGISQLYSHQAEAVSAIKQGEHLVIVTGTASGKSLCYQLPVLESWFTDQRSRALFLYPTKALAQDQLKNLIRLFEATPEQHPLMGTYDGDTPVNARKQLRDRGNLVLTNPDMLHQGILPKHPAWSDFFSNLKYVVLDEIHSYRGVFGSNVANVLRRLRRICNHYGSNPVFICTSATINNPLEHAQELTGLPMRLVANDGAPRGCKYFVFWNPPYLDQTKTERKSANSEAAQLMAELMRQRIPTITFAKARVVTELIYRYVQDLLQKSSPGSGETATGLPGRLSAGGTP